MHEQLYIYYISENSRWGEEPNFNRAAYVYIFIYIYRALLRIQQSYVDCYHLFIRLLFFYFFFILTSVLTPTPLHSPMTHLGSLLQKVLPSKCQFELLHLQSPPTEISPLVTTPTPAPTTSSEVKESSLTVKTQHFFTLCNDKRVVYGLEVHVYITFHKEVSPNVDNVERLLFVSKADTNGYSTDKFSARLVTLAVLEYLLSIDPNYYLIRVIPLKRQYKTRMVPFEPR